MTITLNGTPTTLPDGASLLDALATMNIGPAASGIAVALDQRVVRRVDWATTLVHDGACVEIVTAAQGG